MRLVVVVTAITLCGHAAAQLSAKKPDCNALKGAEAIACMEKYGDCSTPEWLSPPARAQCTAEAHRKSDQSAKADRAAIDKRLDTDRKKLLRKADVAFEAFARADCEFDASEFTGGSLYSTVYNDCMVYWTEERAKQYSRIRRDLDASVK